ncbi:MAG: tRNA lysidine(34) synthetase TilS [Clostridia bacterium]
MEKVIKNMSRLFAGKNSIAVGVSGGVDSVVLLNLLSEYSAQTNIEITAIHVNHNLRGNESERDELFVKNLCKKLKIKLIIKSVDPKKLVSEGLSVESACRQLRYNAFHEVMEQENINCLCLAHHGNDQAETVLMHICRGSGLRGACSMQEIEGEIIRPLLSVSREDIVKYAKENNIDNVEDSSNAETNYARNYIRNIVMPDLQKIYPQVVSSLVRFSDNARGDEELINSLIPHDSVHIVKGEAVISKEVFKMHASLYSRIIFKAFNRLGIYADIEQKHIEIIAKLASMKAGQSVDLPWGKVAFCDYENIVIGVKKREKKSLTMNFKIGKTVGEKFSCMVTIEDNIEGFDSGVHYADYLKIPDNAVWRTREEGDVFQKLGAGTKKFADYLTDKKIPLRKRDDIYVLASDSEILAVAGYDISDKIKIDADTERIAVINYNI